MREAPFRCSSAAAERGDPMIATAPHARRWLLIEQEGPWPRRALDVFAGAQARAVARRAHDLGARISLIRTPRRHPRRIGPFRWAIADLRPGREGIRWHTAYDLHEVIDTAWDVEPGEGEAVVLVCCHSKHDVCCALRGRPVAAAMQLYWPQRVWECSHLGGDRFAATAVILPDALWYGRLDSASAPAVLAAHEHGLLLTDLLRGRGCYDRHVQVAQALARTDPLEPIVALQPVTSTREGEVMHVTLGRPDVRVTFREHAVTLPTPATCHSRTPGTSRAYELLDLQWLSAERQRGTHHDEH